MSALFLLLLFCGSWVAVPVSLAMPAPVMCGMACCQAAGVCACEHQHEKDAAGAAFTQLKAPCGERYASVPSFSQKLPLYARAVAQTPPSLASLELASLAFAHSEIASVWLACACAPRAPPALSLA